MVFSACLCIHHLIALFSCTQQQVTLARRNWEGKDAIVTTYQVVSALNLYNGIANHCAWHQLAIYHASFRFYITILRLGK